MRDRLDRAFDRFRTKGDTAALADVFDRTAPELLRVALRLVRDPGEADDLLQATYLTAIERAEGYEPSGRLVGWLIGILVRHAHELRRRRLRTPDPERLERAAPVEPQALLEGVELEREMERAIARLSATERSVLEPFLREGKRAIEIARELGLAPGTVRTRLHRGLDHLRKALPAGLALEAGALVLGGGGLAAVRAAVLSTGAARVVAPATTTGSWILGGLTVTKKLALLSAGLLAVVALGAVAWQTLSPPPPSSDPTAPAVVELAPSALASTPLGATAGEPALSKPVASATDGTRARVGAPELLTGGARGRLLEADGRPVAGMQLALVEWSVQDLLMAPDGGAPPRLVAATSVTGPGGEFTLRGARAHGTYLLVHDPGGPRGGVRTLGNAFVPGGERELGDVVLAPTGRLTGVVFDREGRPLRGATVRATHLRPELLGLLADLEPDGGVLWHRGGFVLSVPAWIARWVQRLPLPTTTTDAAGRFTFDALPARAPAEAGTFGLLSSTRPNPMLLVTHPDFLPGILAGSVTTGAESALDAIRLEPRPALRVRVSDSAGAPVEGAEVLAGSQGLEDDVTVLRRAEATGEVGVFRAVAHPTLATWAAARGPQGLWVTAAAEPGQAEVTLALPAAAELLVDVVDAQGQPLGAALEIVGSPVPSAKDTPSWLDCDAVLVEPLEESVGRYRLRGLGAGAYTLTARAGDACVRRLVELVAGENTVRLELAPPLRFTVRVEDAAGEPVEGALVALFDHGHRGPFVDAERTPSDGATTVLGRPADLAEPWARVVHPAFAPTHLALQREGVTRVVLGSGGGVRFHGWPEGGALTFQPSDAHLPGRSLPDLRLGDERADGESAELLVEQLEPGSYDYQVFGRFPAADATLLLDPGGAATVLARGSFFVVAGRTAEVVLELGGEPGSEAGTAQLAGILALDDGPLGGADVVLYPAEGDGDGRFEKADAQGRFDFGAVPAGRWQLIVSCMSSADGGSEPVATGGFSVQRPLELAPDQREFLTLEWSSRAVRVHVATPGGTPVVGATVMLLPEEDGAYRQSMARTAADGWAETRVLELGAYRLWANHAEWGMAAELVELREASSSRQVRLVLDAGVPCAGEVVVAGVPPVEAQLHVLAVGVGPSCSLRFEGGRASFSIVGLQPGEHMAMLYLPDGRSELVPFELPAEGARDLTLRVALADGSRAAPIAVEAAPAGG